MKNKVFFVLLFLLSYFIPKKKNLLIFGGGDGKQFQGNSKYLLLFLIKNNIEGFEYYWSSKTPKQQENLKRLKIPFVNPYTWKGFFKLLRANYMFIEKSSYDTYYSTSIFGRFNFIQTCHGSPQKKFGIDVKDQNSSLPLTSNQEGLLYKFLKKIKFFSRQKYKVILAPSKRIESIYRRAFENNHTVITGYPRNDILYNTEFAIKDYKNKLKLYSYKQVVLYAPTFRDNKSALSPFCDSLSDYNNELKRNNILFIVKKHPWQASFVVPHNLSHVLDVSESVQDIQELLPYVNVLITDYSGTFFDFMLTNRPIIFYPYDLEEYLKQCRGLYYNYYEELPGPFAHTEEELFRLIFSTEKWSEKDGYRKKYKAILDKYNQFQDGKSSERVLKYLYPELKL